MDSAVFWFWVMNYCNYSPLGSYNSPPTMYKETASGVYFGLSITVQQSAVPVTSDAIQVNLSLAASSHDRLFASYLRQQLTNTKHQHGDWQLTVHPHSNDLFTIPATSIEHLPTTSLQQSPHAQYSYTRYLSKGELSYRQLCLQVIADLIQLTQHLNSAGNDTIYPPHLVDHGSLNKLFGCMLLFG